MVQRVQSILVPEDDAAGPPLADKEGLTCSTSWAILNTSNQSSPQLSPVSSDCETSVVEDLDDSFINGLDESDLSAAGDNTHTNTVLEAPDEEKTMIEEHKSELLSSVKC